jgi:hypothetical protein
MKSTIEITDKLANLSLNQQVVLPNNVKNLISTNVRELKEFLKDDKEYADFIIKTICNSNIYKEGNTWINPLL